jgi:hypothetical protein
LNGPNGAVVARARLGRAGAMRAVRVRLEGAKPAPALQALSGAGADAAGPKGADKALPGQAVAAADD